MRYRERWLAHVADGTRLAEVPRLTRAERRVLIDDLVDCVNVRYMRRLLRQTGHYTSADDRHPYVRARREWAAQADEPTASRSESGGEPSTGDQAPH